MLAHLYAERFAGPSFGLPATSSESPKFEKRFIFSVFSVEFEEARTRYTEGVGEVTEGFRLRRGTTLNGNVDVKI